MKYFVVFQNKSYTQEKNEGILWAPKRDKGGHSPKFFWKSMTECKPGDVVFSVVKNKIVSRGIVLSKAITSKNPFSNNMWTEEGWLVKLEYNHAIDSFKIMDEIEHLRPVLPEKYSPFNHQTGRGNQGYLFPITNILGKKIDDLLGEITHDIVDVDPFELSDQDQALMHEVMKDANIENKELILVEEQPPTISNKPKTTIKRVQGHKTDYIKKQSKDLETGLKAELLVYHDEKQKLKSLDKHDLADQVNWVSQESDAYGYDILSFEPNGKEKYIEVKGTTLGSQQPFNISANEVKTSKKFRNQFWLYRVYHLDDETPSVYKYRGSITGNFELVSTSYKAYIK